mmetsp:Transcript_26609/g.64399  ORF Transcript_26609/g.64399 Transcript_26609/m.64399 type:complete len:341 (+) Transcript_26609:11169-12191(+)
MENVVCRRHRAGGQHRSARHPGYAQYGSLDETDHGTPEPQAGPSGVIPPGPGAAGVPPRENERGCPRADRVPPQLAPWGLAVHRPRSGCRQGDRRTQRKETRAHAGREKGGRPGPGGHVPGGSASPDPRHPLLGLRPPPVAHGQEHGAVPPLQGWPTDPRHLALPVRPLDQRPWWIPAHQHQGGRGGRSPQRRVQLPELPFTVPVLLLHQPDPHRGPRAHSRQQGPSEEPAVAVLDAQLGVRHRPGDVRGDAQPLCLRLHVHELRLLATHLPREANEAAVENGLPVPRWGCAETHRAHPCVLLAGRDHAHSILRPDRRCPALSRPCPGRCSRGQEVRAGA